jgi:hypothetical protein
MTRRGILKAMSINDMVKSIDESEREEATSWTVWVGGSEMDTHLVSLDKAQLIADEWRRRGYNDVVMEEVI